ncbi:MAG: HisA/HisF-related TIM barrel protein, partial [Flammeovirgaceae bacterium]
GAKDGKGKGENWDALQNITGHTKLRVNFGGGINTDGDVQKVLEYNASSFTVGSLAATNKRLFTSWIMSYGRDRVVLSADAFNGKIQVRGWQKSTDIDLMEHLDYYYQRSIQYVKCSDVSLDGMLDGPNFELYKEIGKRFPEIKLLASGGVSSIDDIKKLNDLGLYGVIFGRAYYENKISLTEIEKFISNLTTV